MHANTVMDIIESLVKKLKQVGEWLVSMHKQMTDAYLWKVQVI